jgi:hypoxanthine phosphoribosyltransferase
LGGLLEQDYEALEPLLVAPLKSSAVFLADLSRALGILHGIDLIVLKDLDSPISDRHVLIVEDVVDTGLTLHFLARTLALRNPASLSAVTLLDRPYRRLVDDLPLRYVGFTVPDELFAGYGLGLDERWRALPNLHYVTAAALPAAAADAA